MGNYETPVLFKKGQYLVITHTVLASLIIY